MSDFIGTLAPDRAAYWDICKAEGLWGIVGRGSNWRSNAVRVKTGDRVFIWRSGHPNGFIAKIEARGPVRFVGDGDVRVPWPDPDWFGAVFPMRVVLELATPEGDTFPNSSGRMGSRFGFNNTVLQHIFEEIPSETADRIDLALAEATQESEVGTIYLEPQAPAAVSSADPFAVDPDLVDRGTLAHHLTVNRLAAWVSSLGLVPLLPAAAGPQFDLAWWDGAVLNVAEVKSVTASNEESQLRLGLGQVLRYRSNLRSKYADVRAWLVPEHPPSDSTWNQTCTEAEVRLFVP